MKVKIRDYKSTDYSALVELLKDVYDSNIKKDILESKYVSDTRNILIAVDELDRLLGCTFIEFQEDYVRPRKILYVTYVAVSERFRNCGIGHLLYEEVEMRCKEKSCSAVEFTSANYRTVAHSFYHSMGYKVKDTSIFIKEM